MFRARDRSARPPEPRPTAMFKVRDQLYCPPECRLTSRLSSVLVGLTMSTCLILLLQGGNTCQHQNMGAGMTVMTLQGSFLLADLRFGHLLLELCLSPSAQARSCWGVGS